MIIQNNQFILERLKGLHISNRFNINGFRDFPYLQIDINDVFIEEFSSLHGNMLCQMGFISYSNSWIPRADIKIGRYCSIATGLDFIKGKHPLHLLSTSSYSYDAINDIFVESNKKYSDSEFKVYPYHELEPLAKPTIIENDVYICTNALLKAGITLHTGCVVAEKAVVTKDVPPYAIVGGIPAKVIKYRFNPQTIQRLLKLQWWQYNYCDFKGIDIRLDINKYLDSIEKRIENAEIKKFEPKKVYFEELLEMSKTRVSIQNAGIPNAGISHTLIPQDSELKGAMQRVKNELPFKIGSAILRNQKPIKRLLRLPFILYRIKRQHRFEEKVYNYNVKQNPHLKLPKLESYPDYKEAMALKECLEYKLGTSFLRAYNTTGGGGDNQVFSLRYA